MFTATRDWLDRRTGYRQLLAPLRHRMLRSGPSWGYTTASCLLWLVIIEGVTGLLLMATYSPSITSAWASVHYIEQTWAGALIRGLHYWVAQAIIVLVVLHVIRVLLAAVFRAPQELVWISGLVILPLMVVWAITGNPLSGTVEGMAQIEVEGNIIGSTPGVGPPLREVLIGGDQVGHLTLTHLHFLHVALLPLLVGLLLTLHISQIYRHGLAASRYGAGDYLTPYFPYQTVRNMTVLGLVLAIAGTLAWRVGAPLGPPADPQLPHSPRPEWYFLSLFELRRYFVGPWEFVATIVIPAAALLLLLAMPLVDRVCSARASAVLRVLIVLVGLGGVAGLTAASVWRDRRDPAHQQSLAQIQQWGRRARLLADHRKIPPEGAIALLRDDAATQGPLLFRRHCACCHPYTDAQGRGIATEKPTAADLYGFASREWLARLLDPKHYRGARYFGNTKFKSGEMAEKLSEYFDGAEGAQQQAKLRAQLEDVAMALSAEARLPAQKEADRRDAARIARGTRRILGEQLACTECHQFHDQGDTGSAPSLTGYGSREWLVGIISNPAHERFYSGDANDRMPAFARNPAQPKQNLLSPRELDHLVTWLRGEWFDPQRGKAASSGP